MPHRKGQPEIFPDETEGQIALRFESRDDVIRCLDTISTLEGLVCVSKNIDAALGRGVA